jgi:ribonuclease HI
MVLDHYQGPCKERSVVVKEKMKWECPERGWAKLNVDGAFSSNGGAGTGMVLRDHKGEVIFVACRDLQQCRDATEAELMAIEEGLHLSLHWTAMQFTLETDCAEAVELIKEKTPNTSAYAFRISVIRDLLRERGTVIVKINRAVNTVSHDLAKIGRVEHRTAVWLRNFPQEIAEAIANDYNPPVN